MSEKEKEIIGEKLADALRDMDEESKDRFNAYIEGMAQGMKFNPNLKPAAGE